MILKNRMIDDFSEDILRHQKQIILFGAGTLLQSWIAYIVEKNDLLGRIQMIADNSPEKWGKPITLNQRCFLIEKAQNIASKITENTVILITSSYFAGMIEQLDKMPELHNTECYIAPVMYITNQKQQQVSMEKLKRKKQYIPKVIHYCWFGLKPMPERNRQCIESWKKYCPDYEIIEWN